MRRRLLSGLVLALLAGACAGDDEAAAPPGRPPAEAPAPYGLWLSATRVPPGRVELVAILRSHGEGGDTFGVLAHIERWDGDGWRRHRQVAMCMDHWHCTAEPVREVGAVQSIGLSATPEQPGPVERFTTHGLAEGWYRVSQTSNEGSVAAGILEVAEGAPEPAPLAPIDEPAISVAPALVDGNAARARLDPLIPAPDGSQTHDDVRRAVEGLPETAVLERWGGSEWKRIEELRLETLGPGESDTAREVELPALEPGEYRLIRSGGDGEHVGRFWVPRDR